MDQSKLRNASEELHTASESVDGEPRERLLEQARTLASLADAERGPDHGRVARHQQKLRELKGDAPTAGDAIDRAISRLDEYRETVEGV